MMKLLKTELYAAAQQTALTLQKKQAYLEIPNIVNRLAEQLLSHTYIPQPYTCFAITDTVPREILAPSFPDRIVHRWLVNKLEPYINKRFLPCSYANRKGKGHHQAVNHLQRKLQNPDNRFYLKMDIQSFFNSINHQLLLDIVFRWLEKLPYTIEEKNNLCYVCKTIITHNPTKKIIYTGNKEKLKLIPKSKSYFNNKEGVGLPLGNLSSQFFANIYLHELDFFVKHQLNIKYYIRYVDDFILLSNNTEQLKLWQNEIERYLQKELQLTLHPKKRTLQPVLQGIDFLGYIVKRDCILVRQRIIKSFKRKLYFYNHILQPELFPHPLINGNGQLEKLYRTNKLQLPIQLTPKLFKAMQNSINSYYGVFRFADSYRLRKDGYLNHFKYLQHFFYGVKWFEKIGVMKKAMIEQK